MPQPCAIIGNEVGLPTAILARSVANTVENWCQLVLPEELRFFERSLELSGVCQRMLEVGSAQAIREHKQKFLPEIAEHFVRHVVDSLKFSFVDSTELAKTLLEGSAKQLTRSLAISAIAGFKLFEESIRLSEAAAADLQKHADDLSREVATLTARVAAELGAAAAQVRSTVAGFEDTLTRQLAATVLGDPSVSGFPRAVLEHVVAAALALVTGGTANVAKDALAAFASTLELATDAFVAASRTKDGLSSGARGVAKGLWSGASSPTISIPIVIPIPNPFLPGILPDIKIEVAKVVLPAEVVGRVMLTALLDATGIGPLFTALDTTLLSLQATQMGLAQVKALLGGQSAAEQRAALQNAAPASLLSVTLSGPAARSSVTSGQLIVSVKGANMSFVEPVSNGLPQDLGPRVIVRLNGQDMLSATSWHPTADGIEGRLNFTTQRQPGHHLVEPPVALLVAVAAGTGDDSASAWYSFVPSGLPRPLVVSCITPDRTDSGRTIDAIGGVDGAGKRWRLAIEDATALVAQGDQAVVSAASGQLVPLLVARSPRGTAYLRARPGHGVRLGDLPTC